MNTTGNALSQGFAMDIGYLTSFGNNFLSTLGFGGTLLPTTIGSSNIMSIIEYGALGGLGIYSLYSFVK